MSAPDRDVVDALRTTLKERDRLRKENTRLLSGAEEPIAIVGMSCRFPGGVETPEQLWQLVAEERDVIGAIPTDRGWEIEPLFDPDPEVAGTTYVREGGFLADAAGFDAGFFGISPREALASDAQQRLSLECGWEALEAAGLNPLGLKRSQTGVFVGLVLHDYGLGAWVNDLEGYLSLGNSASVASGRIAYTLGLEGPALTIDTACSSSLVTIHLAVQSLRRGECSLALAGGSTVISSPSIFIDAARQRSLAPDGRCKAFAESADGLGAAEGAGMVLLERLSDAQRNGRRILAVIRGSAINQDGASNGLPAPSGPAQERVIRQALANARLQPADVDAVEAHGTGTPLGDPIEANALLATYGQDREQPLLLGSVKSNIGHTQAAAGVAGVIKMVMAMREGVLPKTLHVDSPSSKVDWTQGKVELLAEPVEWTANGRPRRAGISSFGISGTNAHLILEQPPAPQATEDGEAADPGEPALDRVPLLLSAKSEGALRDSAGRLAAHLERNPELDLGDVAHSLAAGKPAFEQRALAVGRDRDELRTALAAFAAGGESEGIVSGSAREDRRPVFLFSGYGSQWPGMALELIEASPRFARRMRECTEALEPHLEWNLDDILRGAEGVPTYEWPGVGIPALFATSIALADLWRACGVEPAAVAGHSQGEIVAACVAGAISLDEAAYATVARIEVMKPMEQMGGTMAAVALSESELEARLEQWQGKLDIATLNGPASSVVSGDIDAVEELVAQCEAEGIQARKIRGATGASHSHHAESLRGPLLEALGRLAPRSSEIPFYSTVTGERIDTAELDAEYWYRNLRQTVRLAPVVGDLIEAGHRTLIEVSPHPVLTIGLQETAQATAGGSAARVLGTLRRKEGGSQRFAISFAEAIAAGAAVEWETLFGPEAGTVPLPTYPFQHQRYWVDSSLPGSSAAAVGLSGGAHPFLGAAIEDPESEGVTLAGRVSLQSHPWLVDHAGLGTVLFPGTGFVEVALRAGREVGCELLEELTLQAPLLLPDSASLALRVTLGAPGERGERSIAIYARPESGEGEPAEWTRHAEGVVSAEQPRLAARLEQWPPPAAEPIDLEGLYDRLADAGFEYGPAFQGLTAAWRAGDDVFAEVSLAPEQAHEASRFGLHPALLDSALHSMLAAELDGGGELSPKLPFAWEGVAVRADIAGELRVKLSPKGQEELSLLLADNEGTPLATVASVRARELPPEALSGAAGKGAGLLVVGWREVETEGAPPSPAKLVELSELNFATSQSAAETALAATASTLSLVQEWLGSKDPEASRLVLLTRGAVAATEGEDADPVGSAVWGLLRSAQTEHPGRIALIDSDGSEASAAALAAALDATASEPELALREGRALAPRLAEAERATESLLPPPAPWALRAPTQGTLEGLALVPAPQALEPLGPSQVRVAVHAAGVNFRDVLSVLGLFPGEARIGGEGAGVVVEVGAEVEGLVPGDRVLGPMPGAFGPLVVAESQLLVPLPAGWSFEQGAALPMVYATAYFRLFDTGGLKSGERVLIHAGAGGVGMAAIQLAQRAGAEVFATASPSKWGALRELGIAEDHIASSRDTEFGARFLEQTGGQGVDVVLNSLTGEFIDASLALMPRGGRFLEMGKADLRDPERIAAEHPGVSYRAEDLGEMAPQRLREVLLEVVGLLEAGELSHAPLECWDVRHAREAFRHLREGHNVGKIVLSVPRGIDPERTVLISGGTGGLGGLFARHLVTAHGARHLLLISRSGREAQGAAELEAELTELGAEVRIEACDAADREQLAALIASIDPARPLGAVVHAAGTVADGTVEAMVAEQLHTVFAPKVDGAWHLHELTAGLDLSAFVLVSGLAGTMGTPGQANYAAANSFLDGLAAHRKALGLAAESMAWGVWGESGGAAGMFDDAALSRMERAGVAILSDAEGLRLFDAALGADLAQTVPAPFNRGSLRRLAEAGTLPALLSELAGTPRRRRSAAAAGALAAKLAMLGEAEREALVLDIVRGEAAAVLGHDSAAEVDPDAAFKQLGFDSLAAVELRNRLAVATGIELPAAVGFDYPSPRELASYLLREATGGAAVEQVVVRAQASEEPIAIVGMACRFPGEIDSPQGLWEMVAEGREGISEFPADRGWDLAGLYHPDPDHQGTTYQREGGFLADVAGFDAAFFGISPREALSIDPQQRLLLETVWEALEDARVDLSSLRGSATGTFAGITFQDYIFGVSGTEDGAEGYRMTGMAASVASGRIAYALGLEGPAITIDTACSSSLVAAHLAAAALRSGECSLALAGGATVLATPGAFIEFSRQRGGAIDSRSKSFAEGADGIGISEGVGVLVLERLSDAEANGHSVLATIRGSAVNQDGASNGLTAPNGPSQERVIRQALANARLEPRDVDVVEAHGTGTVLGDPIEAGALLATYGQDREAPLWLGSIKSNIGHTQAAAGVAGVIKTVMAMREGMLPKTLHVDAPSSKIDWEAGRVELLTEPVEWRPNGHPRRAAVSSFGISGTNAHLILEEGPRPEAEDGDPQPSERPLPFVVSAKSAAALREAADRLADRLERDPGLDLADVAHSLLSTRVALEQRAAVVGEDREQVLADLRALAAGEPAAGSFTASARSGRLAYLFTGQGSQRAEMGKGLYEAFPAYAEALNRACAAIDEHLERPLADVLFAAPGSAEAELLDHTTYAQPALFATEFALHGLLESWGLRPDLLAGHSVGEIVAAHIAGVFSLADAAKLICARGKLMGDLPEGGAMLAIEADEEELAESLTGREDAVSLAAVNGPRAVVVSGAAGAIAELESEWAGRQRKTKRLVVSHAFHSPLIEPMLEEFAAVVASLELNEPSLPVISNTSGEQLTAEQAIDPAYWVAHARQPVRFADSVAALERLGASTYLELGPDPVLSAIAAAALENESKATLVPTLRAGRDEASSLTLALASAHAAGATVEWARFFAGTTVKTVPLPTYPFQRKPYWISVASAASDPSAVGQAAAGHPFLGAAIEDPDGEGLILTGRISLQSHPWLADHVAGGTVLLPGTAFVELAQAAGLAVGSSLLSELTLQAPLVLPESGGVQLQVRVGGEAEDGGRPLAIHARPESGGAEEEEARDWVLYAEGVLSAAAPGPLERHGAWPPTGAEPVDTATVYDGLAAVGLDYGPAFQGLTKAWRLGEELYAEIGLAEEQRGEADRYGVHPALLDAALHAALLSAAEAESEPHLPAAFADVALVGAGVDELRVKVSPREDGVTVELSDGDGKPLGRLGSVGFEAASLGDLGAATVREDLLRLEWRQVAAGEADRGGAAVRELVELELESSDDPLADAGMAARGALKLIQSGLAEETGGGATVALLSTNAVVAAVGESADLTAASALGIVRSAQIEHPGRFAFIDSDGSEASQAALPTALALSFDEPQLALREGHLLAPRIVPASADGGPGGGEEQAPRPLDPERTVLIAAGPGGIGALLAQHLRERHGLANVLLVENAAERGELEAALASIDPAHPLGAVICAAGGRDAAWHLHELTAELNLSAFVLFSSVAGTLGSPGREDHAASSAFLDALAGRRRSQGLAALSIGWGLWERESALLADLDPTDRLRLRRLGGDPLSDQQGLALFDAALGVAGALVLAGGVNRAGLRTLAEAEAVPPILLEMVPRRGARRAAPSVSLADKLATLPEAEHEATALELVRREVAAVLGHASAEEVAVDRPFNELGFDSLAAVEMRNRLGQVSGLSLPATVVFDYPTTAALASYLLAEVKGGGDGGGADAELGRLEAALGEIAAEDPRRQGLAAHLRALAADLEGAGSGENGDAELGRLESASDEELLEFIDEQVGG